MSPTLDFDQRVEKMLGRVFKGIYHVHKLRKENPWTWRFHHHHSISTWDFDQLTRLVLGAHEYCLRVEIRPGGAYGLSVSVCDRVRDGELTERHPEIQEAIERWSK